MKDVPIQLHDMREAPSLNSEGLWCNTHTDQTALKMCAVKLVDIRKIQELDSQIITEESLPTEVPDKSCRFDGEQQPLQNRLKMSSVRLVDCRKIPNRRATDEGEQEDETYDHESKNDDFIVSSKTSRFHVDARLKVCLVKLVDCGKIQSRKVTAEGESSQSSSDQEDEITSQEQTTERNFPRKVKFVKSVYALGLSGKHIVHNKGQMVYQCRQCSRVFMSSLDFGRHQNVHIIEKAHHCTQCGKKFLQRSQLRRHQKVHAGEAPYQCT